MTTQRQVTLDEALAVLDRHIASHEALAHSDAYSAQEAPRLHQARATFAALGADAAELLDATDYALRTRDDAGNLGDTAEFNLRAAIDAMKETNK